MNEQNKRDIYLRMNKVEITMIDIIEKSFPGNLHEHKFMPPTICREHGQLQNEIFQC